MARWSCSMRLFKYWLVRTFTLRQHGCSRRSSHSALARTAVASQQLTEQGPGRYNRSIGSPEAVGLDVRQFKCRLKRVPGLGRCLEVAQRICQADIAGLHLNKHPRLAIANDQEIHFAFKLVPQVPQLEVSRGRDFVRYAVERRRVRGRLRTSYTRFLRPITGSRSLTVKPDCSIRN